VIDRQTDGRTDGRAIAYSALSLLSRAKNANTCIFVLLAHDSDMSVRGSAVRCFTVSAENSVDDVVYAGGQK